MTARTPRLLRWTEEVEAQHVRALANLEPEARSAAARPKLIADQRVSAPFRSAMLPRLLSWFGAPGPQIGRDGDRPAG